MVKALLTDGDYDILKYDTFLMTVTWTDRRTRKLHTTKLYYNPNAWEGYYFNIYGHRRYLTEFVKPSQIKRN